MLSVIHASCSENISEYPVVSPDVTHRSLSEPIIFFARLLYVTEDIMPVKDCQDDIRIVDGEGRCDQHPKDVMLWIFVRHWTIIWLRIRSFCVKSRFLKLDLEPNRVKNYSYCFSSLFSFLQSGSCIIIIMHRIFVRIKLHHCIASTPDVDVEYVCSRSLNM